MTKSILKNIYKSKPVMKLNDFSQRLKNGTEILDPVPLAEDLIGARPLSMQERYEMFTQHQAISHQLVYDDFDDDDDFHDALDDLPENGLTPHEVSDLTRRLAALKPGQLKQLERNIHKTAEPVKASKKAAEPVPSVPATPAAEVKNEPPAV